MRTYVRSVLAMLVPALVFVAAPARAGFQTFTTADGLAQDGVQSVLEAEDGALWFGTYLGGVSRFDGVTWATFDSTGGDLPGNNVFDLHQDSNGDVWAATNLGASRFDGRGWQHFGAADGLPGTVTAQIEEDGTGALWARGLGQSGVARFDGTTWTHFTTADGLGDDTVNEIYVDRSGVPWFATAGGASRYVGGSWQTLTTADGLASNQVRAMLETSDGAYWFATETAGVSRFDGSTWTTFTTADGLANQIVDALFEDSKQTVWAGTSAGVSRFEGGSWTTFDVGSGLADNYVDQIIEDSRGFVWFGGAFAFSGASRFDGTAFEAFSTQNGLGANNATRLLNDRVGNLWLTSATGGVTRFDGVTFRRFGPLEGLPSLIVQALEVDSAGVLWVGTPTGVNRFDGSTWSLHTTSNGLPSSDVSALLQQSNGVLWAGTASGAAIWTGANWQTAAAFGRVNDLFEDSMGNVWAATAQQGAYRFDGTVWTQFLADLIDPRVRAVGQDSLGNMWFGTMAGASRFDGTGWTEFDTDQGLPTKQINALLGGNDGVLWFGTEDGVSRYDGQQFVNFKQSDGLAGRAVKGIAQETNGVLWFATQSGVSRFDGGRFVTLGEGDGLSGPFVTCVIQDPGDRFWFGTQLGQSGLTRYEPDRVPPRSVIVPPPPELSSSRSLTITYVPAFAENRVEFETFFDGVRRPWGGLNFFQQQAVADGQHTFAVRARDQFGNAEPTARTVTFEIDATQPQPQITFPGAGAVLKDAVEITGTTDDLRFNDAAVLVRPVGAQSWQPPAAMVLYADSIPVVDSVLTTWDTSGFPEGDYELTTFVTDTLGLIGSPGPIRVTVDNLFPFFQQTAPARVTAATGGNVYTTNSEVKLFFPPNAFTQDAQVMIDRATGSVPDTIAPGVSRVTPAFDVGWLGAQLQKPSTLQFNFIGAAVPPGAALALYVTRDSSWTRLGGTFDRNLSIIGTTFDGPGRYALFSEINSPSSGAFLSSITLSPRVFSPRGNFSETRVAIGFTIGQAAPVTVKIYNRAGRHVNTVTTGQTFGPGNNLVYWDGMDRDGKAATEGMYIVTVEALDEKQTKTLAVVK